MNKSLNLGRGVSVFARCHLAPSVLGGSGDTVANLVGCWKDTNIGPNSMRTFEFQAETAVRDGNVVLYTADAFYQGVHNPIPYEFQLSYTAWSANGVYLGTWYSPLIQNDGDGQYPNLGVDLTY